MPSEPKQPEQKTKTSSDPIEKTTSQPSKPSPQSNKPPSSQITKPQSSRTIAFDSPSYKSKQHETDMGNSGIRQHASQHQQQKITVHIHFFPLEPLQIYHSNNRDRLFTSTKHRFRGNNSFRGIDSPGWNGEIIDPIATNCWLLQGIHLSNHGVSNQK